MNILQNNDLLIQMNNTGGELCRIYSKKDNEEYLWNGDSKYWGRFSPVLFPIVGRLKDNETYINGELYNMSQHGFARDMDFEVVDKSENNIEFSLSYTEETLKKYPFKFKLNIIYTLINNTIDITWIVKNVDNKDILFGIGAHPAFNVPFDKNSNIEDYFLTLDTKASIKQFTLSGPYIDKCECIEKVERIDLNPEIFKQDAIIYSGVDEVVINSTKSDKKIAVSFKDFPYVGIWSPYYNESNSIAPFVCIEPWYGIADSVDSNKKFEEKQGINKLGVNEEFKCTYSISIL